MRSTDSQPEPSILPHPAPAGAEPGDRNRSEADTLRETRSYWRGLLLLEWRAHNRLMLAALLAWLILAWALPQMVNPGWILAFGLCYALVAGPAFGGNDVIEGCEEFSFSQPATRSERYLARLIVGGGMLLVFTLLDTLALGLDLSQAIERLYLDTGLVRSSAALEPHRLYGLVLFLPLAVFSFSFALAANARSRALAFTAWFWGGLAALVILRASLRYEFWKWQTWTGSLACSTLALSACLALWIGARAFRQKEVVQPSKPLSIPAHWWLWVTLTLLSVALGGLLLTSLSNEFFKMLKP